MAAESIKLYSYWRSSACYRVRIALNLKRIDYQTLPIHLLRDGGEQHGAQFSQINPQELIPVLHARRSRAAPVAGDHRIPGRHRARAIRCCPLSPAIASARARSPRLIACDIHPLGNLRVLQYLESHFGADQAAARRLDPALDPRAASPPSRRCCRTVRRPAPSAKATCRPSPTAAWSRRSTTRVRFGIDLAVFPTIARIERRLPGTAGLRCRAAGEAAGRTRVRLRISRSRHPA